MTREERARAQLLALPDRAFHSTEEIVSAMIAFADAEAAAMRERAALIALKRVSPGFAASRENATAHSIAAAIRALPATGEVGRV